MILVATANDNTIVRREIKEDGGYCDCEVLCNCYEEYDI